MNVNTFRLCTGWTLITSQNFCHSLAR